MRKLIFGLALATSILPSASHAQVTLDMTKVTCANYLAMSPSQARTFSAWMSGYFRASRSEPVFDFQRFANNKKAVGNYCKKYGGETLMSAIQKSAR